MLWLQVSECIKKQQQLQQTAAAAQDSYEQLCLKYGLDAAAAADPLLLQQQLQVYVHRKLPLRLQRAEQLLQQPGAELLSFYRSFVAYITGAPTGRGPPKEGQGAPLPLLSLISMKGNISLEEAAAVALDIPILQQQLQQQHQQDATAVHIEVQQQGDEEGPSDSGGAPAGDTICWVVEEGVEDGSSSSSSSDSSSSSSSSSSVDTLLGNAAVRRQLLLELTELRAFLYSRVLQSAAANGSSSRKKQQQQQQQQWQQNTFLPEELQRSEATVPSHAQPLNLRPSIAAGGETDSRSAAAFTPAAAGALTPAAAFADAAGLLQLLGWRDCIEELLDLLGGAETLQLLQLLQNDRAFNR